MDIHVQELIDKIKKEGVEAASQEVGRIKGEAQAEAGQIVEAAKKEAERIVAAGRQDAERLEKAGVAALEQASRNLVLAFKSEIQNLLDKIVASSAASAYKDDVLKAALPELLKAWAAKGGSELAVLLPEAELAKLDGFFKQALAGELAKGVEIKPSRSIAAGFHIASKDGSVYYDFSADAVAELLSAYLNPRLAEILKSTKGT